MKTIAALAFGLAAFSGVFASEMPASDLAARDAIFPAEPVSLEKRAPWKWNNFGAKCNRNSACKTNIWMSRPSCNIRGRCTFKCLSGYRQQGYKCVPNKKRNQCSRHNHCHIRVDNGRSFCWNGRCTFRCNKGYHRDGDSCVADEPTCNDTTCYPVQDGYSTCEDGKCSYHCATYLGYTLFSNAAKTAFRCVNLESDPENCGALNNVCPTGYNGKGYPYCSVGECQLDCQGYQYKETKDGLPYCSDYSS